MVPSRNRTILAGLIRDIDSPMATRIEMRSPNPYTNTYIAIAAFYLAMWDGIKACVESGKNLKELEAELSKKAGVEGFYLEKDREYRSEDDVFEDFSEEERSRLFGKPPATVWENMCGFNKYPEKESCSYQRQYPARRIYRFFCQRCLGSLADRALKQDHPRIPC